jgi:hypothetical protein
MPIEKMLKIRHWIGDIHSKRLRDKNLYFSYLASDSLF